MLRAICQTDDINFHIRYVINFNVIAYAKVDAIALQKFLWWELGTWIHSPGRLFSCHCFENVLIVAAADEY